MSSWGATHVVIFVLVMAMLEKPSSNAFECTEHWAKLQSSCFHLET